MLHAFASAIVTVLLLAGGMLAPQANAFTFNGKSSEELGNSKSETPPASAAPSKPKGSFTINGQEVGGQKNKPAKTTTTSSKTDTQTSKTSTRKSQENGGWWAGLFGEKKRKQQRNDASLFLLKLDINDASARELAKVKGIGPSKAAAIVAYRRTHGKFSSLSDLQKVKGIGPSTLAKIRPQLKVN